MELIIGLLVVGYVFFYPLYLGSRISSLESQLKKLNTTDVSHTSVQKSQPSRFGEQATESKEVLLKDAPVVTSKQSTISEQTIESNTATPNQLIEWVKNDFMVKLGSFLLLIALGWFVSYAFANNWIGPAGRIALGLLFGVSVIGLGVWRIKTMVHQGGIFTMVGATTVLLTIFAAREIYDFFTPASSLLIMFLTVAFVAFVSVRYQSQALAVAGIVMGAVAPLLTAATNPDVFLLFSYLTVVVLGTIWVVFFTGWSSLTPVSLVAVTLYGLSYMFSNTSGPERDIALLFAFFYTALFFVTNVVSVVRRPGVKHQQAQVFTAVATAAYISSWIFFVVTTTLHSLLFSAWALVFAIGAYLVYMFTDNRLVFYLYGATSAGLIGAATAAELSGPALTIAFIIEIGILVVLVSMLRIPSQIIRSVLLLFFVPGFLSISSVESRAWLEGIIHGDMVVLVLMAVTLLMVGLFLYSVAKKEDKKDSTGPVCITVAGIYAVIIIWLSLHTLMPDSTATMFSLVIYTIAGLTLFIRGQFISGMYMRNTGAVLIVLVVGRLLFIDVSDMPLAVRIVTFFVIGILLISTAFMRKKIHPTESN